MSAFRTLYIYVQTRIATREEKGAAAVEYGLLVALIAAVIVVTVGALGIKVNDAFTSISNAMPH